MSTTRILAAHVVDLNEKRLAPWRAELEGKRKAATKVHGAACALLDEWVESWSLYDLEKTAGVAPEDAKKVWNMLRALADKFGEEGNG